ncbi:amino acid/amide ABC transporter membrane protein 1 (HAAT family) /amino acid/amide ABC transporter membrane protein 2 (HAAT family) /amino acid/amide ABC transporter ATP-binding protein 1 (HAAT family) [Jatrophihabitans sp. GAS493]|uniref:ABC transporter permease subunit n=1 Tax=Jatrophihabitans sp. GAS493 TaxID=1907575 RepID=UPI000BB83FF2|nr:ATP-binding cassette domain-containing protein [Jatrophihabitans sp. GAS493]SOD72134.1 amino acid/amide ABC transporter membrane protein 1 (HAAT family) /amino acid/amide ABC transporter membrane protein 2 (HAAT family) /amino acid/amide ABC transporter ATP-binding protein 1 (HAAT family) [Jatrophihabitans sp. GAS493]
MNFFLYLILGLGAGAVYGLLAQGIIVIYRTSRVLNFAQGAIAMASAYTFVNLSITHGWPSWVALIVTTLLAAVLGVLVQLLVMGPMHQASPLARVSATLGLLITLESAISLHYGTEGTIVRSFLPNGAVHLWHDASVGADRLILVGIGAVVTAILWLVYHLTQLGRLTTGVSQNPVAVASLGHSPARLAMVNWAIGCGLAGFCGCLVVPLTGLQISTLTMLVVPALAAAIAGNFVSFPGTFAAGLAIGAAESIVQNYVHTPGWPEAVPFIAIVVLCVVRGGSLPTRDTMLERLPKVGSARFGRTGIVTVCVLAFVFVNVGPQSWIAPVETTALIALIGLSIVVVMGFAGQLNLAPYALAGISCLLAAHVAESWGWSLVPCLLVGAVAAVPVGLLVAMPALRTRGANLAAATLGLGVVVQDLIFSNSDYTGGFTGMTTGTPNLFGWSLDSDLHPARYASLVIVVLLVAGIAVVNIRRSSSGRRLLAVRGNERAAASLGISVWGAKLYAFSVSAFLAGAYGVLSQFQTGTVTFLTFSPLASLLLVGSVVLGAVGYASGAFVAGIIATGGILSNWLGFTQIDKYLPLISGLALMLTLVLNPSGLVPGTIDSVRMLLRKLIKTAPAEVGEAAHTPESVEVPEPTDATAPAVGADAVAGRRTSITRLRQTDRVEPLPLEVTGLSVSFGRVQAVRDVALTVQPGEVLGLIGPNGAGKTTAIDAITGFVNASGSIKLGGVELAGYSAYKRAARGLSRSFQAIELFDDLSLAENLSVGAEGAAGISYLRDILAPRGSKLSPTTEAAVEMFGLAPYLNQLPGDLPFAVRRLAGIARCVAKSPSVVLLDEPAAGLGQHELGELDDLIRRLAKDMGMGVVLVEHHLELVMSVCDRIQVLTLGSTLAVGTPAEVSANAEVRVAYMGEATEATDALDADLAEALSGTE